MGRTGFCWDFCCLCPLAFHGCCLQLQVWASGLTTVLYLGLEVPGWSSFSQPFRVLFCFYIVSRVFSCTYQKEEGQVHLLYLPESGNSFSFLKGDSPGQQDIKVVEKKIYCKVCIKTHSIILGLNILCIPKTSFIIIYPPGLLEANSLKLFFFPKSTSIVGGH